MNKDRTISVTIGVLFLIAAIASITGLLLYGSILNDPQYITNGSINHAQVSWGAIFEIITAFAVIGTSVTLYPILKKYNQTMALASVGFRVVEAALIIVGSLCLLTIVTLHLQWSREANPDASAYLIAGKLLVAFRNWTFLYGPNVFLGPSTLMTSYLLYKSRLVPRFISVLGMAGGPLIFCCGLLVTLGLFDQISVWGAMLAVPVFAYEMILAIWLIAIGFNATPVASVSKQNLFKLAASQATGQELI
jgi:hypothetical protein